MKQSQDDLFNEAVSNIRQDRNKAELLLEELKELVSESPELHQVVGLTFSKYLETMQRSNEQLVKLIQLNHKKDSKPKDELEIDRDSKDKIFDLIAVKSV